ncbi:MAG: glycosyltransferase, partial [Bryobacterales bacterium]|nr:glycosyltransferase [Bryobacterales bacterium]
MPDLAAKPSALFLTAESPYPMVGGGALRSASVLEYLLQGYDTDVICFRQPEAATVDWLAIGALKNLRDWREIALPAHGRSAIERSVRNVRRAFRGVPPLVDRFTGFSAQVGEALGAARYDVAVVEHFWCATYAPQLRPHCERLVLDLHNLESLWHQRCARILNPLVAPIHHAFARAAARMENELLPQFDLILATSRQECQSVSDRFPALQTTVVPNTLQWRERPSVHKEASIVFSGNMDYLPNQKAVGHFARAIWPEVLRAVPNLHWKILGKAAA